MLEGRLLRVAELTPEEESAWRDLSQRALEPNPLFAPDCLVPAARNLPHGPRIWLAAAFEGREMHAAVPLLRVSGINRAVEGLAPLRRPAVTSLVRRLRFDGTPLLDRDRAPEAADALLGALRDARGVLGAGIAVLESVGADGQVLGIIRDAASRARLPLITYHEWSRPILRSREDFSSVLAKGAKARSTLAKHRRRLEAAVPALSVVDRSGDPTAVTTFLDIESAGYKGRQGLDTRSHHGEAEWLSDACRRWREAGDLAVYTLEGGGEVIAVHLMVRAGTGWFEIHRTYDEHYAAFGPGSLLHHEVIRRVFEESDASWMDSCTFEGNHPLEALYPGRHRMTTLLLVTGGWIDHTYARLYARAVRAIGSLSVVRERHPRLGRMVDRLQEGRRSGDPSE